MNLKVASLSKQGKNKEENEDHKLINKELNIFVISDGISGKKSGEVASKHSCEFALNLIDCLPEFLDENEKDIGLGLDDLILDIMITVMKATNRAIIRDWKQEKKYYGMGATLDIGLIYKNKLYYCHVGDSRLYILDNKNNLYQISQDHNKIKEVYKKVLYVFKNKLNDDEKKVHPESSNLDRHIGDHKFRISLVDSSIIYLSKIKKILMCTDGCYKSVSNKEIAKILTNNNADDCINKLVDKIQNPVEMVKIHSRLNYLSKEEAIEDLSEGDDYTMIIIEKFNGDENYGK